MFASVTLAVPASLGMHIESGGLSQPRQPCAVDRARVVPSGGFPSEEDTRLTPSVTYGFGKGIIFRSAGGDRGKLTGGGQRQRG